MLEATTHAARRLRPKGDGFGRKPESYRSLAFLAENLRFVSRHVLLTGFEAFGPHAVNPSELLARSFEGRVIGGRTVAVRIFPVETRTLRRRLTSALAEVRPEFAIGLGLAAGRAALGIERVAVNVLDFDLPDIAGETRRSEPVESGGPDGRLATLPVSEVASAWTAAGVPGYVSDSAGTYLCNQWLYEALGLGAAATPRVPAGFVHLPVLPQQAAQLGADRTPSMSLELMRSGIEIAIETTASWLDAKPASTARPTAAQAWIPRTMTR
jgi:pyroglutamyl-peptidase